jgi:hypothetical protein
MSVISDKILGLARLMMLNKNGDIQTKRLRVLRLSCISVRFRDPPDLTPIAFATRSRLPCISWLFRK